ncbi:MAG: hypothetical protein QXH32_05720 [Candidatus Caldarchaeum sp.]
MRRDQLKKMWIFCSSTERGERLSILRAGHNLPKRNSPKSQVLLTLSISANVKDLGQLAKDKKPGLKIVEIPTKSPSRQITHSRKKDHVVAPIHLLSGPWQKDGSETVTTHIARARKAENIAVQKLLPNHVDELHPHKPTQDTTAKPHRIASTKPKQHIKFVKNTSRH